MIPTLTLSTALLVLKMLLLKTLVRPRMVNTFSASRAGSSARARSRATSVSSSVAAKEERLLTEEVMEEEEVSEREGFPVGGVRLREKKGMLDYFFKVQGFS